MTDYPENPDTLLGKIVSKGGSSGAAVESGCGDRDMTATRTPQMHSEWLMSQVGSNQVVDGQD